MNLIKKMLYLIFFLKKLIKAMCTIFTKDVPSLQLTVKMFKIGSPKTCMAPQNIFQMSCDQKKVFNHKIILALGLFKI